VASSSTAATVLRPNCYDGCSSVESRGRLVEKENRRGDDEARSEVEPAAHPPGVGLHKTRCGIHQVEPLQEIIGPSTHFFLWQMIEPSEHLQVLAAREVLVNRSVLARQPDA
jgi:hypothetical protein